jgi:hypothetical protein
VLFCVGRQADAPQESDCGIYDRHYQEMKENKEFGKVHRPEAPISSKKRAETIERKTAALIDRDSIAI